jgi:hypothetical protein
MRVLIVILVLLVAWAALGGPPFMVIALAYLRVQGPVAWLAALVALLCWVVAPWAALIVAWRASRRGVSRGRIALILLVPLVLALLAAGLFGSLPQYHN